MNTKTISILIITFFITINCYAVHLRNKRAKCLHKITQISNNYLFRIKQCESVQDEGQCYSVTDKLFNKELDEYKAMGCEK